MQYSLIRSPADEILTRQVPFDTNAESSLLSLGRIYSKCPEQCRPTSLNGAPLAWKEDSTLKDYSPSGPIGSCYGARSQMIDIPRMQSEWQPCTSSVLEDWAVRIGGAPTRMQAKDRWSTDCGAMFQGFSSMGR